MHYVWRIDVKTQLLRYHYFVVGGSSAHKALPPWSETRDVITVTRLQEVPGWQDWSDKERHEYMLKQKLNGCHYHDS